MSLLSKVFAAKKDLVHTKTERYFAALRSGDHVQIAEAADALGLHDTDLEKDLSAIARLQELAESVKDLPQLRVDHADTAAELESLQDELRRFQESMNKKLEPKMRQAEELRLSVRHAETRFTQLRGIWEGLAARGLADPSDLPEFAREEIAGGVSDLQGHVSMSPHSPSFAQSQKHEGVDLSVHASQRARAVQS